MKNRALRYAVAIVLLMALMLLRYYEEIFYDPLRYYFVATYLQHTPPHFEFWRLLGSISLRYIINSGVSVLILHLLFQNKTYTRLSIKIYLYVFLVLIIVFAIVLTLGVEKMSLFTFYLRRFLIQPLLLFLLAAGFYYQTLNVVKN